MRADDRFHRTFASVRSTGLLESVSQTVGEKLQTRKEIDQLAQVTITCCKMVQVNGIRITEETDVNLASHGGKSFTQCTLTLFSEHRRRSIARVTDQGKVRNMDPLREQGTSKYGPGPWTPFMDRVLGLPIFATPKITEVNKNKIKSKVKL